MRSPTGFPSLAGLGCVAALMVAGLAGCGEDTTAADQYVGTWRYDDAQSTVQCVGTDPIAQPPAANKVFGRGLGAEIVDLTISPLERDRGVTCDFVFDVSGPVATIRAGQVCALNSIDTLTIDQDGDGKPQWTFSLTGPTKAEEIAASTIHIIQPPKTVGDPPTEELCSWSLVAHLTRISKD